jgi:NAD(P)-dependent dehydrogenase (short-subunit alcohol dehydrogenase family)
MGTRQPLKGRVAVVAGATRGAGRGIACMLGEAGATVYCTGRSVRGSPPTEGPYAGRPEPIEETAEMVEARGGVGIPVRVDHLVPEQVEALFERVGREQRRLDVLVNDISEGEVYQWKPFWKLPLDQGFRALRQGIHTHIITSRHAVPLMIARRRRSPGLIVEVTDGDALYYRQHLFYDLVKISVNRMAWAMAQELHKHKVAAVAVSPGFMRSEAMLDRFGVTEANWREGAKKDKHFIASETPFFVGRAIAALAADPDVMAKSGGVYGSWTLSDEYGFSDVDGNRPHIGRHFEQAFGKDGPWGGPKTSVRWTLTNARSAAGPKRKRRARATN